MQNIFLKLVLAGALVLLAFTLSTPTIAQEYAVMVNAQNGFSGDDNVKRTQIKRLYLKEQKNWPGGVEAIPFGREEGSAAQQAFIQKVLGMTGTELEAHWLKLKQMSGETPPRGVGSARILARQIGKKPGAFGVVQASEAAAVEGGKVLFEFSIN